MRIIRYVVASSLDGYIAGPNGEADWIPMAPDIDFAAVFEEFDTLLMGRRTYETLLAQGGARGPFAGFRIVVVSRTLDPKAHPEVSVIADDLAGQVDALRHLPGKDIWLFGGGHLFRTLLDLGLVDTVEVALIPVLLGAGVPLLPDRATRAGLELAGHRAYPKTGTIQLRYRLSRGS
jgi:dihydrofolate reductase